MRTVLQSSEGGLPAAPTPPPKMSNAATPALHSSTTTISYAAPPADSPHLTDVPAIFNSPDWQPQDPLTTNFEWNTQDVFPPMPQDFDAGAAGSQHLFFDGPAWQPQDPPTTNNLEWNTQDVFPPMPQDFDAGPAGSQCRVSDTDGRDFNEWNRNALPAVQDIESFAGSESLGLPNVSSGVSDMPDIAQGLEDIDNFASTSEVIELCGWLDANGSRAPALPPNAIGNLLDDCGTPPTYQFRSLPSSSIPRPLAPLPCPSSYGAMPRLLLPEHISAATSSTPNLTPQPARSTHTRQSHQNSFQQSVPVPSQPDVPFTEEQVAEKVAKSKRKIPARSALKYLSYDIPPKYRPCTALSSVFHGTVGWPEEGHIQAWLLHGCKQKACKAADWLSTCFYFHTLMSEEAPKNSKEHSCRTTQFSTEFQFQYREKLHAHLLEGEVLKAQLCRLLDRQHSFTDVQFQNIVKSITVTCPCLSPPHIAPSLPHQPGGQEAARQPTNQAPPRRYLVQFTREEVAEKVAGSQTKIPTTSKAKYDRLPIPREYRPSTDDSARLNNYVGKPPDETTCALVDEIKQRAKQAADWCSNCLRLDTKSREGPAKGLKERNCRERRFSSEQRQRYLEQIELHLCQSYREIAQLCCFLRDGGQVDSAEMQQAINAGALWKRKRPWHEDEPGAGNGGWKARV